MQILFVYFACAAEWLCDGFVSSHCHRRVGVGYGRRRVGQGQRAEAPGSGRPMLGTILLAQESHGRERRAGQCLGFADNNEASGKGPWGPP